MPSRSSGQASHKRTRRRAHGRSRPQCPRLRTRQAPRKPRAFFAIQVGLQAQQLRIRAAAADLVRAEQERSKPQPDAGTLEELIARPDEPQWRVEGLVPARGRLLVSAQRKAGKTTLAGNLSRSLLTGNPFLGRFPVRALAGRVGFLNYEVSGKQFARWMDDIGVPRNDLYANGSTISASHSCSRNMPTSSARPSSVASRFRLPRRFTAAVPSAARIRTTPPK